MSLDNQTQKERLCAVVRQLHHQGKSPATSTNYSFLGEDQVIFVSRSGIDKSQFQPEDFMAVDSAGLPLPPYEGIKPSAETLIHCFIYQNFPGITSVLHTHSVAATLLSGMFASKQAVTFRGYEVIKGIAGQTTHETAIALPIFANDQNMEAFCQQLAQRQEELSNYGFLIAKHGLYAWGETMAIAKRHLEVWEFMLECELEQLKITPPLAAR
ncbi:methylthioribulose-1-phosphate dehydratase [Picosynechococcus sp. PCC 7003]|uniref:methylthioribulose 1-phosphate dehydratase n=1 Tax=Picosynechococcus sp. PCC 7003 TaxID=374981 RepID=UPI00081058D7|nr:methylthioribulose 1-phosphate dehydratase [Picosynechococcus sp. PCC 7003]ANV83417.1 methylthioribulose-1-phosphate dehydratase [Picosynechococcus sp. PCC 7003]